MRTQSEASNNDAADPADDPTADLGRKLKAVRRRRRETLAVIAERTGLTRGFLSKLENGQVSVSVGALLRLCSALQIELPELLHGPSGRLIRAADRQRLAFGGDGLVEYLLTPADEHRIQVQLTEIVPFGSAGDESYELPLDVEFVHVLVGHLQIEFPTEIHDLGPGDSLTFASAPHTFRNPTAEPTTVLWVLSPGLTTTESPYRSVATDGAQDSKTETD